MKKLPLLISLASAVAIYGVFAGWFFRGFSATELEQLDRDWAQIVAWADLPDEDPEARARTAQFVEAVEEVEVADELLNRAQGGSTLAI